MKITNIRVVVTCPGRNYVLVKVETDQAGLFGWGDATLNGRELAVASALRDHIAPLLIGRDPDRIEDIWQYLYKGAYWRGGPVLMTALAGIDLALWDIKGRRAGLPVYSLLGGRTREGALAYVHCDGADRSEVEQNIRAAQAKGFKAFRAQVGIERWNHFSSASLADWDTTTPERWEPYAYLQELPAIFEHLRVTLGGAPLLVHDVHHRLNPIQAARLAKSLEQYELLFLEDPIHPEHADSLRLLRQQSSIPIGFGELINTRDPFLPLLTDQLIDFVRCDVAHIGGITETRKIAALAEAFNVQMALHGAPDTSPIAHAANVHLDLAMPNFGAQELCSFPEEITEVFTSGVTVSDGYLDVSDRPGLGVEVNEEAAARYPYQRGYLPTMRRADASVHDW
ncbi:MAG TPA: D-galactonate dehydratase family protein [Phototrophicaceae bacterium]|nr:D-galactonate dehydratase family protein [Phototrophicaceae bacterium]